jgi:osmotically-inducible protein OsmY
MTTATTNRTDEQIQRGVLDELKWDPRIQPNEIGVSVRNGVATLTGTVDSFTKKWAAEEAAHDVAGVVAVANDIEVRLPTDTERLDSDIAADAVRALDYDALLPAENVEVTVSQGWVTLRGEVEWQFQRRAAERAVRRLAGVRGVTNLLVVRPRVRTSPAELKQQIGAALVRNAQTDAQQISVEVAGDKIILRGEVRAWAEKTAAERIAWSAPGVSEVDNKIIVTVP